MTQEKNLVQQQNRMYWQKVMGNEKLKIELKDLRDAASKGFKNESDSYKQKLVYDLLETVKNNDQKQFFYILLRAINKPKENFGKLWNVLEKNYDVMPEEAFINFAYSIILGIMSTYSGGEESEREQTTSSG